MTDRLKGCTAQSISSKFLLEIESTFWFNQFLFQILLARELKKQTDTKSKNIENKLGDILRVVRCLPLMIHDQDT